MKHENIDSKLDRFKHLIGTGTPSKKSPLPSRYHKLAEGTGGSLSANDFGSYCLITTHYPVGFRYGDMQFESAESFRSIPMSAFTAEESDVTARLGDLLFFDIETTGLGGAGIVPFLVGCGSFSKDGFSVRQYLLPDYPDERAMLEDLCLEFTENKTLVTYNGAAFDLNIIHERFILNRVDRELAVGNHIDLLHPTRRLFRRRLRDCSLTNIERELLGFHRCDDIPGYLVPSVYFDWLTEESLDNMHDVLEHNRLDILTLYFLLRWIEGVFVQEGDNLSETDDIYSLSRIFGRRRQNDKVVTLLGTIREDLETTEAHDMLLYQAQALKRANRWDEAVTIWQRLAREENREAYFACIELAKYCEHRSADLSQAYMFARRAEQICPYRGSQRERLRHRLRRLQAKLR
jgi:uncharacterized protein YprB with RNaseH-like and TPR domain